MIQVEQLVKRFGPKGCREPDLLSGGTWRGAGFLGPNGAGKSTTMRMITGFIPPSEGSVTVGDHPILEQPIQAKRLMGYLPESAPCYPDMTVYGFLDFAAEIRGISGGDRKKAIHRVVDLCFLESVLHQSVDTLSKGYRHRNLLCAIHYP